MQISNQNSPAFGRIYIKGDALTKEQYLDSLDLAENLTKSKIYQQAHREGVDIYIACDRNDNPRALFIDDETGKFFNNPKYKTKPISSPLSIRSIEQKLTTILDSDINITKELYNPYFVDTIPVKESRYNAEPSEENPEHIWLI